MATKKKPTKVKQPRITKKHAKAIADAEFWSKKAQEHQLRADLLTMLVGQQKKFADVLAAQRDSARDPSPATVRTLNERLVEVGTEVERLSRRCFPNEQEHADGVKEWAR